MNRKTGKRDSEADEIISSIRRRLIEYIGHGTASAKRLKEVFTQIDRNGNNRIDRNEFKYAFQILGIELTLRDVNLIFDFFDSDGTNDFDYREFLEIIDISATNSDLIVSEEIVKVTDEICSKIRAHIEDCYGKGFKKDMRILDLFEEHDDHKTSRIYRKELIYILHDRLKLKPRLSDDDIDALFERFDRRNSTTMDYRNFVNLITGRNEYQNLEQMMLLQTNEINSSLKPLGYERKARITRKDFTAILLDELKIQDLRIREIEYLFDRFDVTASGTIDYKEVLDLIVDGTKLPSPKSEKKRGKSQVNDVIEAIRKALADELGDQMNVASRMKEVFAAIDRNGNSRLEKSELKEAMEALKLQLTPSELQLLLHHFDHDGSNNFDYQEFMELIAPARK
eukprot:gene10688-11644_t